MAQGVPDENTYQPRVQPEDLPRKIVPEMQASRVGQAISQVGNTLQAKFDADQHKYVADSATWTGTRIAKARVDATNLLDQMQSDAPAGDQTGFTSKYIAALNDQQKDLTNDPAIKGNAIAQGMLSKGISELNDTMFQASKRWEAGQNVSNRVDSINTNLQAQLGVVRNHPELSDSIGSTLNDQIQTSGMMPDKKNLALQSVHGALTLNAGLGIVDQNPFAAYKDLTAEGGPTNSTFKDLTNRPDDLAKVTGAASSAVVTNFANNALSVYRNNGTDAGAQAYTQIDHLPVDDGMKAKVRDAVKTGLNQWHEEQQQKYAEPLTSLQTAIASDAVPPNAIQQAKSFFQNGTLNQAEYSGMLTAIGRANKRNDDTDDDLTAGMDAFNKHTPLDPKDGNAQKAVTAAFSNMNGSATAGSPTYANNAIEMVSRTGVLPKPAESWARASLNSGNTSDAVAAAQLMSRVRDTNARSYGFAVDESDKVTRSLVDSVNDQVNAGVDPQVAVTRARQLSQVDPAQIKVLDEKWSKESSKPSDPTNAATALTGLLNGSAQFRPQGLIARIMPGNDVPTIPPLMAGEFTESSKDYYKLNGGNLSQAQASAARDLATKWGTSAVNGKPEIMQYAPERMFPGLSTSAVRDDVATTVGAHAQDTKMMDGATGALVPAKIDPAMVKLVATAETARTGGLYWGLSAPDAHGAADVVRGPDGNPIRYRLPVSQSDQSAARDRALAQAKTEGEKAIDNARRQREGDEARVELMAETPSAD